MPKATLCLAIIAVVAPAIFLCRGSFAGSKTLTFADCPYLESPLPDDYGSDKEVSLAWSTDGHVPSLITSTGGSPFADHSPSGANRFVFARGTTLVRFSPTVRLISLFVRDNEPDFVESSASGLTVRGELDEDTVFSTSVTFVPKSQSGIWIEVNGGGAIDTLRLISHDDLTKYYLIDDLEFEIYSETEVIARAGLNQAVLEGDVVTLDGRGSVNAESFAWSQVRIGEEPAVSLGSADQAVTTFPAPGVPTATVLTFELLASGPLGFDTDRVEVTVHISKPPPTPPDGLIILPLETQRSFGAEVEWNPHPDATKYVVYRAEGHPQNDYANVAPSIAANSYTDEWLEEGAIYFYTVAAGNAFGFGPASQPSGFVASRNLAFDADSVAGARILYPTGDGLKDIEIMHNGVTEESYDSYHGGALESEDWYGYKWEYARYFDSLVYHEGKSYRDGGWWTSLTVECTSDGQSWAPVQGLTLSPPYDFRDGQEGRSDYTRFFLTFQRVQGIAIRIVGQPGGVADFTSIAELEVYGDQAPDIVVADAGPDVRGEQGTPITLHGENSLNAEAYSWNQVRLGGEPEVNLTGAETATPTFLVDDVATNTLFAFRLTVAGFHGPKTDTVYATVVNKEPPGATEAASATGGDRKVEVSWQPNNDATSYKLFRRAEQAAEGILIASGITTPFYVDAGAELKPFHTYYYRVVAVNDYGEGPGSNLASAMPIENLASYRDAEPIAMIRNPTGTGQRDLNVIRNGILDEKGYDSFDGLNPAEEDWYGYLWSDSLYPDKLVYTMGKNYLDGGWWTFLAVQYTTDGTAWHEVSNLEITPPYNFEDYYAASPPRPNHSSYTLSFDRVRARGVRLYGEPGGIADFTSIVELEVYGLDAPVACKRSILPPVYTPGETARVTLSVEVHEPPAPDLLVVTEELPSQATLVDAGGGDTSVPGQITWSFGAGEVRDTELSYTISVPADFSGKVPFTGSLSYGALTNQLIRGEASLYPEPFPPENLRLEMALIGHLRWSPLRGEEIAGYHVYRSVNGGEYEETSGLLSGAYFDDSDVEEGMVYTYRVTVENPSGVESDLAESRPVGPAWIRMSRREFEDYNYGGGLFPGGGGLSGVAATNPNELFGNKDYYFHNADASNSYRPGDSVDIPEFWHGGHFVSGVAEGDWWRFSFDLAEDGYVKVADLRVASSEDATYDFFWDELPVGKFSFDTGGEEEWQTYAMDVPAFFSSAGVHTLRIRGAFGVSSVDSFGIGFGWSPPRREAVFAEDFDRYGTTAEVKVVGGWEVVNGGGEPEGAWRLWNTSGPPLAEDEPGPDFPGFDSGYMVSNGDFAGYVELDEELISPEIDCTWYTCVAVQFLGAFNIHQHDTEGDPQTTDFDISVYEEATVSWSDWVNLLRHDRTHGDDFSAIPKWFDVSSLADGRKVKFRWHFYNTHYDYWSAVDDLLVTGERRLPRVVSAALAPGGSVSLSWESFGLGLYTVEFCDDILEGSWQPVAGTDWPIAETTWQGDALPDAGSRFYRVRSE